MVDFILPAITCILDCYDRFYTVMIDFILPAITCILDCIIDFILPAVTCIIQGYQKERHT